MERWFEHCNSSLKILLVGKGDFSFSASTSLESQGTVFKWVLCWQNTEVIGHIWKN
ncbi:cinnamoyl-CoA reductase 1-like [Pyrus ussuriensis x Pyrus communis]|uniref:Cinnamoyl-CoA reductase 1-like n=1 Tax=Pyrus ussuriensis x Pyrus communis TaxID=2448454 RepID=A0A5N5I7U9_9ROSA|nr:cinnamoyl-CoA reductase 1-like [Pyrus ussuriensis x Pyrus communis]